MQHYYLLYRTGFAATNGTSVQLDRLLAHRKHEFLHVLWDEIEGGSISVPNAVILKDSGPWPWPFSRGKGLYAKFRNKLQYGWWVKHRLGIRKLKHCVGGIEKRPAKAYVIVSNERDAANAVIVWRALGKPKFVLHIMDILHRELNDLETPYFMELVRQADHVICISAIIEEEVRRWGANTSILPCVTDFNAADRAPFKSPFRVVMTGVLWQNARMNQRALDILMSAWPKIQMQFAVELHYAGAHSNRLPGALRDSVIDHGRIDLFSCQKLLRSCHMAYLPVSYPSDSIARFSVPSRLADYLGCGLPTVTCADEQSGIAAFMHSVPASCAVNVADAEELVEAASGFASNAAMWSQASFDAAAFAHKKLRADAVSEELFRHLHSIVPKS